jgi:hypothetical protein
LARLKKKEQEQPQEGKVARGRSTPSRTTKPEHISKMSDSAFIRSMHSTRTQSDEFSFHIPAKVEDEVIKAQELKLALRLQLRGI